MSNITLGNLYDLNKSINKLEKTLTATEKKRVLREIKTYFRNVDNKYFMLLCKERSDYTIFAFNDKNEVVMQKAMQDIKECFDNRGKLISVEPAEGNALEIWLRVDDESFVYYLFPYDVGVIEEGVCE